MTHTPENTSHASSPHDRALYETGRKMLMDSVDAGREFCKLMIIISISSIPTYLYLLVFALPHDANLGVFRGIMLLVPAITFLLAAATFSLGFLSREARLSLNSIDHIESARIHLIRRRNRVVALASMLFVLGALASMVVIVKAHL